MYKNYIFDFYGTLVDIHTDETMPSLWKQMAMLYCVYGADYTPVQLQKAYIDACREAEEALRRETGYACPEIDLAEVLIKLLDQAPKYHDTEHLIQNKEEWVYGIANAFRIRSRKYIKTYPHTAEVLKQLKRKGRNVYILSNAQKIFTMPEMEQSGILPYVDGIYISSEYRMKKPQPEFLALLLKQENLRREESIMIGNDCFSDVASAVANEMASVFLDTAKHSRQEADEMIRQVCQGSQEWVPYRIEDGDIRKVLRV